MSILLSFLLIAGQAQPSSAAARADKFALDLPGHDAVPPPADPAAADQPASEPPPPVEPRPSGELTRAMPEPSTLAPKAAHFSLDTPIADLIADPAAKAVLDHDMPGLTDDENLAKFKPLSLRRLAPLSGGQMTAELMNTLAYDLAALGGGAPPPKAEQGRRKLPSGR